MFQAFTSKLSAFQGKLTDQSNVLNEMVVDNAKQLATIHFDTAKQAARMTQDKVSKLLLSKDPKEVVELLVLQTPELPKEIIEYHVKIQQVVRQSAKEVASMVDLSIDESKAELIANVRTSIKQAPAGSEQMVSAFQAIFDVSIQAFDQSRANINEALASLEKNIESMMETVYSPLIPAKTAAKGRKQIAAEDS